MESYLVARKWVVIVLLSIFLAFMCIKSVQAFQGVASKAAIERPRTEDSESAWIEWLAEGRDFRSEVICPDGSRADLVGGSKVYEVERAHKWQEAIGQCVLYSILLEKEPAIILLMRRQNDNVYFLRCKLVCRKLGISLETLNMN